MWSSVILITRDKQHRNHFISHTMSKVNIDGNGNVQGGKKTRGELFGWLK